MSAGKCCWGSVSSLGFAGHTISAAATQLCFAAQKQPQTALSAWEWPCANKTQFTKTGGGWFGPWARVSSPCSGVPGWKETVCWRGCWMEARGWTLDVCACFFTFWLWNHRVLRMNVHIHWKPDSRHHQSYTSTMELSANVIFAYKTRRWDTGQ